MTDISTLKIRRCTYCAREWDLRDGGSLDELCSFRHAHSSGWYRTKHDLDTITIAIPDDPSGLWEG
ncbi:MAG TPA: hypothetical protein VGG75_15680 [Trebonia sp.]|jgi:hypothetical protein